MTRPTHRLAAAAAAAALPLTDDSMLVAIAVSVLVAMGPDVAELHTDPQRPDSGWVPHRGPTHALLVALALGAALVLVGPAEWWLLPAAAGITAGWASHGVADALTRSGAALAWPLYRKPVHLLPKDLRVKTGSWSEWLIALPAIAGGLVLLVPAVEVVGVLLLVAFAPSVRQTVRLAARTV